MSCFAQTSSGDLDLTSGNLDLVTDPDTASAIKLTNRLQLFLGEWFRDTRIGFPYFQFVYVKDPDLNIISQLFKRAILQTPRFVSVLEMTLDFISSQRSLNVTIKAQTSSGAIIEGGPGNPFIVTLEGKDTNS